MALLPLHGMDQGGRCEDVGHRPAGFEYIHSKPTSVPWLAIHAMPSMPLILFKAPHALKEAGDLERCIAWTVIEGMTGSTPLAA